MATQRTGFALSPDEFVCELTPREHEVAALINQALTNEAIAQQLTLSTGTVANHVAHILAKTGARSRVQLAVHLVRTRPSRGADDVVALLTCLQALGPTDLRGALQRAAEVLSAFFGADACDALVANPAQEILVALASSRTPLAERQRALGLHHLPLSDGGRVAWVFQQQQAFRDGHVEDDMFELPAVRHQLGVRSTLAVPFAVSAGRRGVLVVRSVAPDQFGEPDLDLLRFVAY
ncbi:MAG TPA: LuxR C-terminal-related transcriptional regulator, partial [Chloroflexota bacterium]|jgi:DNA-binding CsgD family transcriptional regulator